MKLELKSIGIWSFIKISFVINLIMGFLLGILYAFFFSFYMKILSSMGTFGSEFDGLNYSLGMMLVIMPIMMSLFAAFFHTILGVIVISIYNLFARWIGGLVFKFENSESENSETIVAPVTERYETPPPPPALEPIQPAAPPTEPKPVLNDDVTERFDQTERERKDLDNNE